MFLTIFRRFPTTFKHLQRFSKIVPRARQRFPNIFWRLLKVTEDLWGGTDDVSIMQQYIWTLFKRLCCYSNSNLKEARKGFLLLQLLWNDGRLQRRIFNDVGKLYVSLQLYCWAILWGYLWRHIGYHGNAQGAQKRPLNFSFCKLSEILIRWPIIFISLLESSLNSLTFQTVWKKFI